MLIFHLIDKTDRCLFYVNISLWFAVVLHWIKGGVGLQTIFCEKSEQIFLYTLLLNLWRRLCLNLLPPKSFFLDLQELHKWLLAFRKSVGLVTISPLIGRV